MKRKVAGDHSFPDRRLGSAATGWGNAFRSAFDRMETFAPQLFLLLIVVLAVYLPVCGHEFLNYDDPTNLSDNEHLLRGMPADFFYFWQHPYANLYIPVTYNLWGLVAKITAETQDGANVVLDPAVFHTLNLLAHLANAVLVFGLFRRLLTNSWAALAGALFFALHPMQVASVAWSSEFRGVLSVFWALLSINLCLFYYKKDDSGCQAKPYYVLALLFYVLAMLSKPSTVVLPLLICLVAFLLLERSPRQLMRELLPWLLLALPVIVVNKLAQQSSNLTFHPAIWQRVLIAGDSLTFSLYKLLLPYPLGPDYGRTPEYVLAHGWVWFTGLLPWLLMPYLWFKTSRKVIFPVAFWGVVLLPVLGLVSFDFQKISTVTNRYCYLAMLGPAFGIACLWARYSGKRFAVAALLGILVMAGLRSSIRVRYWENDFTFNKHALRVNPESWLANNNLGFAYFNQGQPQAAIPYYQKAIKLRPENLVSHTNLGDAQVALGLHDDALVSYQNALKLSPRNPWLFCSLGETYLKLDDNQQAIVAFREAIISKPDYLSPYLGLSRALGEMQVLAEAETVLLQAIDIDPGFAPAYLDLAKLYLKTGRLDIAAIRYDQAAALGLEDAAFADELEAGKSKAELE